MKAFKNVPSLLLLASLVGCGQQLVQFLDLSPGEDLSVRGDLAMRGDLAGRDLSANDDMSLRDDLSASTDMASHDLASHDLAGSSDGGGDGFDQPLMVIAVTPLDLAIGVPTFRAPTATFNHAMNPATLDTLTFTLREQGALQLVTGSVSYDAVTDTAVFNPESPLLVSTTYVATVTTLARDTMGESLASDYTWSFTTAAQACGMSPVFLGSAGNFGVIAGLTITSGGPTIINGDIAVSPGSSIVGFGASPGVAGPGIVNGTQRKPPDPAAAQAVADLTTAYNDAAGRSLCFVTITDGELGGLTITPGLYRSGISSFSLALGDLKLDALGDPDAVFIFQTSTSTLTIANNRAVTLAGGAKASNVFWSVGTSAVIGTTAILKGTILADQSISMNTGSTLDGRALARAAAVTLLSDTISMP